MPPSPFDVSYADPAVAAFLVIPAALVAVFAWGVSAAWRRSGTPPAAARRAALATAAGSVVWLALTWILARTGALRQWERTPPPFMLLVLAIVVLAVTLACSRVGYRVARFTPLWLLVAAQGFRLPLELAMHRMAERGIMPGVMTYTGRNFDIVTGAAALVVAALVVTGRGGRRLVTAWNVLGLSLLLNVMAVAMLATPRIRYFGDDQLNLWVAYVPFVWLPAVMVPAALAGHLVIFRALRAQSPGR